MTNPHGPATLTWQIINSVGLTVWNISHTATPYTWWPNLYPDICKIALGAPANWDIADQWDLQKPPTIPASGGLHGHAIYGCGNPQRRYKLRKLTFYVCPSPGNLQQRGRTYQCGGVSDFYCSSWGCETTGDTYWKPTSTWDFITVKANYSHVVSNRVGAESPCQNKWCNPIKISFTEAGKKQLNWVRGYSWGLRFFKEHYDDGLTFTIKLSIDTPRAAIGPNPILTPPGPVRAGSRSVAPPVVT